MCRHLEGILDDKSAALVARYLASSRAFSRSFDIYLQQVRSPSILTHIVYCHLLCQLIRVLSEPEVRMRTRAMKALSCIIDADPSILSRVTSLPLTISLALTVALLQPDMQRAVQYRFMDQSTLVREAAVDLLGRSVLSRPELTEQYYDMLSERILVRLLLYATTGLLHLPPSLSLPPPSSLSLPLCVQDTGVSVRKRVIKILKDICVLQPQFPRTSEICVKMMRRISDEEGIKVRHHQHGESSTSPFLCVPSNW